MTEKIMVPIPEPLYARAVRLARLRNRDVAEVVATALAESLPPEDKVAKIAELVAPDDPAEREMQAYIAMHPRLKEDYFGMHVAVHGGELVDHDRDLNVLYARIDHKYPHEFVWLATVEEEPVRTLNFRSPRFGEGD